MREPGELTLAVREDASRDVTLLVIDGLNGYLNARPGEQHLIIQLHAMLTSLGQSNVATLPVSAQHGLIGSNMTYAVDASYLAVSVVLMRYFEAAGEVRQCADLQKAAW